MNAMHFSALHNVFHNTLPLSLNGANIIYQDSVKFLGCFVDKNLRWKQHFSYISNRVSKGIVLLRTCNLFSVSVILSIYFALIYSYLSYCIAAWGNAPI